MSAEKCLKLEKELAYYKELYEVEKETNELNDMKINELNSMNAHDNQRFELEKSKLRTEIRRLETEKDRRKEEDSASTMLRQRIHQLEREVAALSDRVRIAENVATKFEDTCRAKDFEYGELQKDYEMCLARCNALELQVMSMSQNLDCSMNASMISFSGDMNGDAEPILMNGRSGRSFSKDAPDQRTPSPSLENGCHTPIVPNGQLQDQNFNGKISAIELSRDSAAINLRLSQDDEGHLIFPALNFAKDVDINLARKYCQNHPGDVESLLKFADMVRTVRLDAGLNGKTTDTPTGRIPRAVQSGIDSLKDLQRRFSELTNRPSA